MALEVDRTFPDLTPCMEPQGYRRWRRRIPETVVDQRPCLQAPGTATAAVSIPVTKDPDQEKNSHKKMVTMAPRSKYLSHQNQYPVRKPLFGSRVSILKKPALQKQSEQKVDPGSQCEVELRSEEFESSCSPLGEECLGVGTIQQLDSSSLSASGEDWAPMLTTAELRGWSSYEEPGTSSDFSAMGSHRRCLSSPPVDVRALAAPLQPSWTSTQRSSSVGALAQSSQPWRRGAPLKHGLLLASGRHKLHSVHHMSPHRARYWACAIPSKHPPSSDRTSPSWDPNKEYEALLDYTYPLRPNLPFSVDSMEYGSLVQTDPVLQDSGIELDRFCSSTSLSCGELPPTGKRRENLSTVQNTREYQSPSLGDILQTKSADSKLSSSWQSSVDHIGLSVESLLDNEGSQSPCLTHSRKQGVFSSRGPAATFIRSACILPPAGAPWNGEEEFHPLPDRLQELEALSEHLRSLSLKDKGASWESLVDSQAGVVTPPAEDWLGQGFLLVEGQSISRPHGVVGEESAPCNPEVIACQGLVSSMENLNKEVSMDSLKIVATCMDHLSGAKLTELHGVNIGDQGEVITKNSLMQHIQKFCSNLEELIMWLHKVVQRMEGLSPPRANIESIRSSLASYKRFRKEVNAQEPLTATVLQTGEALLCSMNSTCPVLRDTLALIKTQSQALETHTDHLFSSILSAMDSLTNLNDSGLGLLPTEPKTAVTVVQETK